MSASVAHTVTAFDAEQAMTHAHRLLARAEWADTPADRFAGALAASDFVAAVVVRVRTASNPARGVWGALLAAAPEFGEWAGFFVACHRRIDPGPANVTARQADDLLRDAHRFCEEAARWICRHRAARSRRNT